MRDCRCNCKNAYCPGNYERVLLGRIRDVYQKCAGRRGKQDQKYVIFYPLAAHVSVHGNFFFYGATKGAEITDEMVHGAKRA